MLVHGHGLACWEPRCFEPEIRPHGIIPGDVGTYTTEDGFKVAFNLWDDMDIIHEIAETIRPSYRSRGLVQDLRKMPGKINKGRTFVCEASMNEGQPIG
jgi:hypothetical protein